MFSVVHLGFDLVAYVAGAFVIWWFRRRQSSSVTSVIPKRLGPMYFFVLTNGVIFGSLIFGSANIAAAGLGPALGKSIIGALVGGIAAVELFKRINGLRGSTGAALVPGLCLGIFIGRWGCLLAGLDDYTYGIASAPLPGIDFGDGVERHAVPLYEGFTMLAFGLAAAAGLLRGDPRWWQRGFYYFAFAYGIQRFVWEFLKPYPTTLAGLTIFQYLCIGLMVYGLVMLRAERKYDDDAVSSAPR